MFVDEHLRFPVSRDLGLGKTLQGWTHDIFETTGCFWSCNENRSLWYSVNVTLYSEAGRVVEHGHSWEDLLSFQPSRKNWDHHPILTSEMVEFSPNQIFWPYWPCKTQTHWKTNPPWPLGFQASRTSGASCARNRGASSGEPPDIPGLRGPHGSSTPQVATFFTHLLLDEDTKGATCCDHPLSFWPRKENIGGQCLRIPIWMEERQWKRSQAAQAASHIQIESPVVHIISHMCFCSTCLVRSLESMTTMRMMTDDP